MWTPPQLTCTSSWEPTSIQTWSWGSPSLQKIERSILEMTQDVEESLRNDKRYGEGPHDLAKGAINVDMKTKLDL